jgi:phosphatidylglycerophosphate synthase
MTTGSRPFASGVLVVLRSEASGGEIPGSWPVAGLPLLRRIVLAAERAGFERVLVAPDGAGLLAGTAAEVLRPDGPFPSLPGRRLVLLPAHILPQPAWLRCRLEMPVEPERLYVDGDSVLVIEPGDLRSVVAVAMQCASTAEAVARLRAKFKTVDGPSDEEGRFVVASAREIPAAEAWLLRGLIKANESFMSRHVERRISLALTSRLAATSITPNGMTMVSVTIGLLGALFFLSSAAGWQLLGACLFLAHSILDGCDGELARLKFLESARGARLDIVGDNLVHVAVFTSMAVGWSLQAQALWPLVLGGVTLLSTLAAAVIVHGRGMRASVDEQAGSPLSRLADALVYRDFIYVIVLLASLGLAHWFLVLTAVGAPTFLAVLAWIGVRDRARRRRGRAP